MLDLNQPPDIIDAGIEAAKLLGFSSFIQPLNLLIFNHPNEAIQEKADKVIQQIKINPQINDPKYSID